MTVLAIAGEASLAAIPGETWSFWTFDPAVRVSIQGVRWPLKNADIAAVGKPSISNEAVDDQVKINTTGGSVIVMRRFSENTNR
jgi:thiamine pyrophosphokinase